MTDKTAAPPENVLTLNPRPQKAPELCSPEWFKATKEHLEIISNEEALKLLQLLEAVTSKPPVPDEVEILKNYTGDPNCRRCGGSKRLGILTVFNKEIRFGKYNQLQLCTCATHVKSEYARIEEKINEFERMLEAGDIQMIELLKNILSAQQGHATISKIIFDKVEPIDRHTFGHWIARGINKVYLIFKRVKVTKEAPQNIDAKPGSEEVKEKAFN